MGASEAERFISSTVAGEQTRVGIAHPQLGLKQQ